MKPATITPPPLALFSSPMASTSESYSRDENLYMAKLAHEAERHEDMVRFTTNIISSLDSSEDLTVQERSFLFVALKTVVDSRRRSWRAISKVLDRRKKDEVRDENKIAMTTDYLSKIEQDLVETGGTVLNLLDSRLIPNSSSREAKVFYLRTKGDYHRYLAECGIQEIENNEDAFYSYRAGRDLAIANRIQPGNPHRLALEVNFSAFYRDGLGLPQKALDFARDIHNELPPDTELCVDSIHLANILRANIHSWIIEGMD